LTKTSIFYQNFDFRPKLRFLNKILYTVIGLQMEWITPIGLPVQQMAYKSRMNKALPEEVLLTARDENVLINQRQRVYGCYPEVNASKSRNQTSPNFVHSIDASHAMTPFFIPNPLLYRKHGSMVIQTNLYSLCSPGNHFLWSPISTFFEDKKNKLLFSESAGFLRYKMNISLLDRKNYHTTVETYK